MSRRRVARTRERRDRRSKWMLRGVAAGVLALGAVTGWTIYLATEWNPELDEFLCPVDRESPSLTVVIIDGTDTWNPTQRLVVEQEFRRIQQQVERFGRIDLYAVRRDAEVMAEPVLSLCNPGQPSNFQEFPLVGEFGARVVANPEQLVERWNEDYSSALQDVMAVEASSSERPVSPIMETVRASGLQVFGSNGRDVAKSLILFSDLLQNSNTYSVYRDPEWSAEDGERLSDLSTLGTAALSGVPVQAFLLDRDVVGASPGHERTALIELWDAFFAGQQAILMRVRRIEG